MFHAISRIAEALQGLLIETTAIRQALDEQAAEPLQEPLNLSPITDRLDKIELGYAKWEAQAEANLLKADALFKNARNAEERTRASVKKTSEALESSAEGEEAIRSAYAELYGVQDGDVEGGENGEVPAVHPLVEADARVKRSMDARNLRLMAKFR